MGTYGVGVVIHQNVYLVMVVQSVGVVIVECKGVGGVIHLHVAKA